MDIQGLTLCSRFSYPPNSLSLCGPEKQKDLNWYSGTLNSDKGNREILEEFSTLYPYLTLIASQNKIKDPFDTRVVEAYWLGNNLLSKVPLIPFVNHLSEKIALKKKIKKSSLEKAFIKISKGALPNHSFHVLNIYKRTGNLDILHDVESLDACIINWGKVLSVQKNEIIVDTNPLTIKEGILKFGKSRQRILMSQGYNDKLFQTVITGDWITYHWGYFCQKLSNIQLKNLIYYTKLSVNFANNKL